MTRPSPHSHSSSSRSSSSSLTVRDEDGRAAATTSLSEKKEKLHHVHWSPDDEVGEEEETTLLSPTGSINTRSSKVKWRTASTFLVMILCTTNLITLAALAAVSTSSFFSSSSSSSLNNAKPETSKPLNQPPDGPARQVLDLVQPPQPTRLNQPFWNDEGDLLRVHSSNEGDAAWDEYELANVTIFYVSKEDGPQAGIDPTRHAYVDNPDENEVGYVVALEVTHQIHCLNMIRKYLYFNYEHTRQAICQLKKCGGPYKDEEEYQLYTQHHIDHCVDLLRQRLACTSDLGLVPFMWMGTKGRLYPDTARMHTCNDYDAVRDWAGHHLKEFPKPGGKVRPKEGEFHLDGYI